MQGADQSAGRKRKPFYRAAQSPGNSVIPASLHQRHSDGDLDFALTSKEADFLHRRLTAVPSPAAPWPSLLARLAVNPPPQAKHCWDKAVLNAAAEDRRALERAGQAAALAAIGRGVYAALAGCRTGVFSQVKRSGR
jgi:hypothetical protein